ncbi:universal stress protein [Paraburkholderia sediminicola]|uniref:universal stress protein n=1 Tax=Paraburkholderia sediminicola TaxID=458836 RepID=UPI0038B7B648
MSSFGRVLLCYDATREGQQALREAAALVEELTVETHVLSILSHSVWVQGADITSAVPLDIVEKAARDLLQEGLSKLAARGIRATGHFVIGEPLDQIPLFAKDLNVDLIVVGHRHATRLARWWAGNNDGRLLDRVSCSVLVAMCQAGDHEPNP